jgi:hypothetical protein
MATYPANFVTAYRETAVILALVTPYEDNIMVNLSSESYINLLRNTTILTEKELVVFHQFPWETAQMPPIIQTVVLANLSLGDEIRLQYANPDEWLNKEEVIWVGPQTKYAPADVVVRGDLWSLKQNSKVLKNSSSAKLLNSLLNVSLYGRGYHLLAELAEEAHNSFISNAIRIFNNENPTDLLPVILTHGKWKGVTRPNKKRLSYFIEEHRNAQTDIYAELHIHKEAVNAVAASAVDLLLLDADLSLVQAGDFLGTTKSYNMAVITSNGSTRLGVIPSDKEISKYVTLERVYCKLGQQLDIMLVFRNQRDEILQLQCEIRYSHGQLVGVPECKTKIYGETSVTDFLLVDAVTA